MATNQTLDYDALVVGGGIAGLQAALDLADQDYRVAIVERDASIGGKMIRLSKVFPTLDCASCITTPKMAAAAHHPNITLYTYAEVRAIGAAAAGPKDIVETIAEAGAAAMEAAVYLARKQPRRQAAA